MELDILTVNDLNQFKKELMEELKELINSKTSNNTKYLRSSQVRKMLNISDSTLKNFREKKVIPSSKLGDMWIYKRSHIENAIENGFSRKGGRYD